MNNIDKKRVEKAYLKIDSIAKKGKDGIIEFNGYVDELIDQGKYYIIENVLERKYKIDSSIYSPIDIKSEDFYSLIRFKTASKFQENLKKLYDFYQLYVIGIDVYKPSQKDYCVRDLKIGTISEISNVKESEPGKDIIVSTKYILGDQLPCDQPTKYVATKELIISDENILVIDKYKLAIEFLLN